MIIAIEGCIASGKSTTARLVAKRLSLGLVLERADEHPFLSAFYENPNLYAVETELAFALLHYHQLHPLDVGASHVSDFSIGKDLVFARMNLSGEDLKLFEHLYSKLVKKVKLPELTVFLDLPVDELMRRMKKRGRVYETNVPVDYLQRLRDFYQRDLKELGEKVHVLDVNPKDNMEEVAENVLTLIKSSF